MTVQTAPQPTRRGTPVQGDAVARGDVSPVRTRRPVGYLAAAIALIVVGGLIAVFLYTSSQRTEDVFVAAHTIDRGATIKATDLTTLAVAPGQRVQGFTTAQSPQVIGKVATTVVPQGGLVTPSSIANNLPVPASKAIVGLSLKAAQLPSIPLHAGDKVVLTPVAQQNGISSSSTSSSSLDVDGTIVDSPTVIQSSGTTVVNVYVSQSVASDLTGRAAAGLVALYLTAGN